MISRGWQSQCQVWPPSGKRTNYAASATGSFCREKGVCKCSWYLGSIVYENFCILEVIDIHNKSRKSRTWKTKIKVCICHL